VINFQRWICPAQIFPAQILPSNLAESDLMAVHQSLLIGAILTGSDLLIQTYGADLTSAQLMALAHQRDLY
jgi:hypothetical protein